MTLPLFENETKILKVGNISAIEICEMLGIKTVCESANINDTYWILPDGQKVLRPMRHNFEDGVLDYLNIRIVYDYK